MANSKKIDSVLAKKLSALKINASTEDEARKKLLAILEKEGVDGMEEEDTETLIDMVDSFIDETDEDDDTVDESEEDTEEDDEEDTEENDNEDDDEEDDTEGDSEEEDIPEEEDDAEEKSEDEVEADELAKEVEEEDAKKTEKKTVKKETEKKTAKKEVEKTTTKKTKKTDTTTKEVEKKTAKKEVEKTAKSSKRGVKLNPKNSDEDKKPFECFKKIFDEGYRYDWISTSGVTIKRIGKNSVRGVVSIDSATKHDDGKYTGNLYLLTMGKQTDVLDELGIDYKMCWMNSPYIKGLSFDEMLDILEKVSGNITSFVTTVDKRLGDNRKKMEENLKNSGKKVKEDNSKKPATAKKDSVKEKKAAKKSK